MWQGTRVECKDDSNRNIPKNVRRAALKLYLAPIVAQISNLNSTSSRNMRKNQQPFISRYRHKLFCYKFFSIKELTLNAVYTAHICVSIE